VKFSVLQKGEDLWLNICACYWWEMASKFVSHLLFDNITKNMIIDRQRFGKHSLKDGIMKTERMSIAEHLFGNHVSTATKSNDQVHC
jgi:hypothetical protein